MKHSKKKNTKDLGVPRPKAPGRSTAAAGYAEPTPTPSRKIPQQMLRQFDAYMDIGWSQFALKEMAKNLKRPDADVDGIYKACLYHLKAIIRNKKKLGDDTAADEVRLTEFLAQGIAAAPRSAKARGVQRKARSRGTSDAPKPQS